jgi:hypothetical protein
MNQILRTSVTIDVKPLSTRSVEMSTRLDLPLDLESELSTEASRLNLPLSEYILRVLSVRAVLSHPPKTGAELVAYWQAEGVINSRPGITDSQVHARHMRHEAETRTRL